MNQHIRIPARNSAAYLAGAWLYEHGPAADADLFTAVHFGSRKGVMADRLQAAMDMGWLRRAGGPTVACTEAAAQHYADAPEPASRPAGQVAAPRVVNVLHRPPISARYRLNPHGNRSDVPAWSVRDTPNFKTKA
jgi:hypothetical protein